MKLEEQKPIIDNSKQSTYKEILQSMSEGLQDASVFSNFATTTGNFLQDTVSLVNAYKLNKNIELGRDLLASDLNFNHESLLRTRADEITKYIPPEQYKNEEFKEVLDLTNKLYQTASDLQKLREENVGVDTELKQLDSNFDFQFKDALDKAFSNGRVYTNPDYSSVQKDNIEVVAKAGALVKQLKLLKLMDTSIQNNKILTQTLRNLKKLYRDSRIPYKIRAEIFMDIYKHDVEQGVK